MLLNFFSQTIPGGGIDRQAEMRAGLDKNRYIAGGQGRIAQPQPAEE